MNFYFLLFILFQLASGGNANKLLIWNISSTSSITRFTDHSAAVKAIAWSPHQHGLLASGGGTADRCIRFWNTLTGEFFSSFRLFLPLVHLTISYIYIYFFLSFIFFLFSKINLGTSLNCVDTGSQVCNLMWSKNINEIVSTHGYSLNQIIFWR